MASEARGVGFVRAGSVLVGEVDVVDDEQTGLLHAGQRDGVIAAGFVVVFGDLDLGGSGSAPAMGDCVARRREVAVVQIHTVVAAAGVVVAEREVDGDAGECGLYVANDEVGRFLGEVREADGRALDGELVTAVEVVDQQIAADSDEAGLRGVDFGGLHGTVEEGYISVDAFACATFLQRLKIRCLIGGRGFSEDRFPGCDWALGKPFRLRRIVQRIEVDIAQHERGERSWLGRLGEDACACERRG